MQNLSEQLRFLFESIMTLHSVDQCESFLKDLCTESELREMSQRLWAAKLLNEGNIYSEVSKEIGLSTATISRVNRCLRFNDGGYYRVLEEMKQGKRRG